MLPSTPPRPDGHGTPAVDGILAVQERDWRVGTAFFFRLCAPYGILPSCGILFGYKTLSLIYSTRVFIAYST